MGVCGDEVIVIVICYCVIVIFSHSVVIVWLSALRKCELLGRGGQAGVAGTV